MPPTNHAILSASSAHRWLECPPSALKNAEVEDTTSPFAAEGTAAHELCEWKVRKATDDNFNDPKPDSEYHDEEMERFMALDFDEDEREAILFGNFQRLFLS